MLKTTVTALLFLIVCNAFSQGIKGIVNDETGNPLPFATIYLKETTTGTTTNELGQYDIQLPAGQYTIVFQGLGFEKQEIKVTITDQFVSRDIQLKKQDFSIKEVRVYSGGEDPAYPIMRKAISLAPYYQRQIKKYQADIYLKGSLEMKKIPFLIKRMMEKEEDGPSIEEGKTYTMESMNNIAFNAPNEYEHTVVSSQSTFPEADDQNVMGYMSYSFYEPNQDMAISPLAPNAFSHYKFMYEGFFYEGDKAVNKIKVIPRRKSQQSYSGYIYIVDQLWNIHSIDVTNDAFWGTINIKQVYAAVKERAWLPVSHRFNVQASIMGVKADFRYAGSVKYNDILINSDLPVPQSLLKQYASEEAAKKAEEEAAMAEEKSKEQLKMESLLAKEELSNREMIKLSRLIEKESRKKETENTSLEVKSTYHIKHKKDSVQRDSSYWNSIRPIPLTSDELKSFELKDSLRMVKVKADTTKKVSKDPSLFSKISNGFLSGRTFYANDSLTRITYHGLIGLEQLGFNAIDGWNYKQRISIRHRIDSVHHLTINPMVQYAFNREKLLWQLQSNYRFAPMKRGYLGVNFGQVSQDFKGDIGIDPALNLFSSLLFKDHYMKLHQKNYLQLNHGIDLAHGLRLNTELSYSYYRQLSNSTNWSLFRQDEDYASNLPENGKVDALHLGDQAELFASAQLSYTPQMRYRIRRGQKYHMGSKYPTFLLKYQRGIKDLAGSDADFELIEGAIRQKKEWGIFNAFSWKVAGGYFTRNKQMHFSRFKHFATSEIPFQFKTLENSFALMDDYRYSTNKWFAEAHAQYTSPYLLLKFLPGLSNRLWLENVYVNYLTQPYYKNYAEVGYGLSQIFFIGSISAYTGFEDGKYSQWGLRMSVAF